MEGGARLSSRSRLDGAFPAWVLTEELISCCTWSGELRVNGGSVQGCGQI